MTKKGIVCILILTILWVCSTQHVPFAGDVPDGMVLIPAGERVAYRDWGPQNYTSVFRGFHCVKDEL
ncbi:MAG: hypothetical protein OXU51_21830 [Candidatus Poribacteria bacterium]|nr:hypothetical protein [Candidatus Poribacteria bacterium]